MSVCVKVYTVCVFLRSCLLPFSIHLHFPDTLYSSVCLKSFPSVLGTVGHMRTHTNTHTDK